jgi:hypothetical protein
VPLTDDPLDVARVKLDEVSVDELIAWLKVAVSAEFTATLVAPDDGVVDVTVGATGADAVVNVHE